MAIPSLLGSYIDQTYQRIVQTTGSGTEFADGLGNPITFGTTNTGSLLTTASVVLNTITFKKGDGTTFPITVNTGSGGGVAFPYTGSATITGSLVITGSTASSLGFTGSLLGTASYVSGSVFTSTNPALSASFALSASRAVSASYATTASYALNARAGGANTQLQYNSGSILAGTNGLTWEAELPGTSSNYLVNTGYYILDFPLNGGGGLLGRGSNYNLFQMGFNAQAQYGGTLGTISGNQFFIYNFQRDPTGGVTNYLWGFNNNGDNFWGWDSTYYTVKIQQPLEGGTPDYGNIVPLEIKLDNTDYTNTSGANSHLVLNNPNDGVAQTSITSIINGNTVAKWRTDYAGNIYWTAGSSGSHAFYTNGDFGVGQSRMDIFNNGNILIKNSAVGVVNIDSGYKLDVSGSGVSGSVRFQNGLKVTGSISEGLTSYTIGDYSHAEGYKTTTGLYAYQSVSISGGNIVLNASYGNVLDQFTLPLSIVLDDSAVDNIYGRQIFSVNAVSWNGAEVKITLVDTSVTTTQANIGVIGIINPTNADQTIGGTYAHTEGIETIALANNQHVQGQYNIPTLGGSAFIIGNGVDNVNRSNLLYASGSGVQITGSLKIKGPDSSFLPIVEFSNDTAGTNYPIQILISDEFLSVGYPAPQGSIGSSTGTLQLKYGAGDTEWGLIVYENASGIMSSPTASYALTASYAMNSGGSPVEVKNQGTTITTGVTSINFTGTGVTATNAGDAVTVTIPGGTGAPGGSNTQVQFNANGAFSGSSALTFNSGSNTLTLTGSLSISGSGITVTGSLKISGSITGSLLGTASYATTASYVLFTTSASYASGSTSASYASSSTSASYASGSTSASYASSSTSASYASSSTSASYASASTSASYASSSTSASYASSSTSASYSLTASYAMNGGGSGTPGGSNTQVQFNANNAFSGSPNFTFNSGSNTLTLTGSLNITGSTTQIGNQTITGSITSTLGFTGSLQGTASYASQSLSASYASNGGVTQILQGSNITVSGNGTGQVTISSTGGGSSYNTATGSYGSFYSTVTQTNVASTAMSMSLNVTDISNGVSISGSIDPYNTYIKTANAGVYNIQFSAQIDKTDSGTDNIYVWVRKNGSDLSDTATSVTLVGNSAQYVAAWNFFVNSSANDYYQLMWYSPDANVRLHAEAGFGVVPGIPSLIVTVNRVDQFLSNTGSFSGSFTGAFTGSLQGTASWATNFVSASNYVLNSATSSFVQNSQTSSMTVATASYVTGSVFTSTNPALSASYAVTASYALVSAGGSGGTSRIVSSSITTNITAAAAASTDYVYLVSGSATVTLPTAVGNTNLYTIKRTSTNIVTVAASGSQTIDGSSTISLNVQYQAVGLISDNANWNII